MPKNAAGAPGAIHIACRAGAAVRARWFAAGAVIGLVASAGPLSPHS
jgi:hypothetical protein